MGSDTIFSIGHGARKIEDFIALLKKYDIEFVIDVRSKPYSRFHPHYNKNTLSALLKDAGIKYVFMGEQLGGIPKDKSCYDSNGRVDYSIIKTKDFFLNGVGRIKTAYSKQLKVACMCSEISPCDCHRSKLIGDYLYHSGIEMKHINKKGYIENQKSVMAEVMNLKNQDLFSDNEPSLKSRKSYL